MRTFILLSIFWFFIQSTFALQIYRYYPQEKEITIEKNTEIDFSIGADDPYGLRLFEWYIDGDIKSSIRLSKYYEEDIWTYEFKNSGTYEIFAYAYKNNDDEPEGLYWLVNVVESAEPEQTDPKITRISPSKQSINKTSYGNIEFKVKVSDDDSNIKNIKWYLNGKYQNTNNIESDNDYDTWNYNFNSEGNFTVSAKVYDEENNTDELNWQINVTQSHTPEITKVKPLSKTINVDINTTIEFKVDLHDEDSDLDLINWYIGGNKKAESSLSGGSKINTWDYKFSVAGEFKISARVYDKENNNNNVEWKVVVSESHDPRIKRLHPATDKTETTNDNNIEFKVELNDEDSDLDRINWYVGGNKKAEKSLSGKSKTVTWDYKFSSTGEFTISARVYDKGNNNAFIQWKIVVTESHDPKIKRIYPTSGKSETSIENSIEFKVDLTDDDSDLDHINWYVDGNKKAENSLSGSSITKTWNCKFNSAGEFTITAKVYDEENNIAYVEWKIVVTESHDPKIKRIYPASERAETSVDNNIEFKVELIDEDSDLDHINWHIGEDKMAEHSLSGSNKTDTWEFNFETVGKFVVFAFLFDKENNNNFIGWEIIVTESHNPLITRISPAEQYLEIPFKSAITLKIEVTDEDNDLHSIKWFTGSDLLETQYPQNDGYEYKLEYQFNSITATPIYVVAYDKNFNYSSIYWEFNVMPEKLCYEFFDDFRYNSIEALENNIWHIVNGPNGPPGENTMYKTTNIELIKNNETDDDKLLQLSSSGSNNFSEITCSRLQTNDYHFYEGTYAAKIKFGESSIKYEDGNVQAFYSYNRASGTNHSEVDFEYLPWNVWGNRKTPTIYTVPWITDKTNIYEEFSNAYFEDWNVYYFTILNNRVSFYINDYLIKTFDESDGDIYPKLTMQIALSNWIAQDDNGNFLVGKNSEIRKHSYWVDWVYYYANEELEYNEIASRINNFRNKKINVINDKTESITHNLEVKNKDLSVSCYPNPFTDKTLITFNLTKSDKVKLEILNIQGDIISIICDEIKSPGLHSVSWDSREFTGSKIGPGLYFYRFYTKNEYFTGKIIYKQ